MSWLGIHVKGLRKHAGISREQLAQRVMVGVTTIENIESGYLTTPPIPLLEKLAKKRKLIAIIYGAVSLVLLLLEIIFGNPADKITIIVATVIGLPFFYFGIRNYIRFIFGTT